MKNNKFLAASFLPFALIALGGCSGKGDNYAYELKEKKETVYNDVPFCQLSYWSSNAIETTTAPYSSYRDPSLLTSSSVSLNKKQAKAICKAIGVSYGEDSVWVTSTGTDYSFFAEEKGPDPVSVSGHLTREIKEGEKYAFFLTADFTEYVVSDKKSGKEFSVFANVKDVTLALIVEEA